MANDTKSSPIVSNISNAVTAFGVAAANFVPLKAASHAIPHDAHTVVLLAASSILTTLGTAAYNLYQGATAPLSIMGYALAGALTTSAMFNVYSYAQNEREISMPLPYKAVELLENGNVIMMELESASKAGIKALTDKKIANIRLEEKHEFCREIEEFNRSENRTEEQQITFDCNAGMQ